MTTILPDQLSCRELWPLASNNGLDRRRWRLPTPSIGRSASSVARVGVDQTAQDEGSPSACRAGRRTGPPGELLASANTSASGLAITERSS
jgi:hypothetical protein